MAVVAPLVPVNTVLVNATLVALPRSIGLADCATNDLPVFSLSTFPKLWYPASDPVIKLP